MNRIIYEGVKRYWLVHFLPLVILSAVLLWPFILDSEGFLPIDVVLIMKGMSIVVLVLLFLYAARTRYICTIIISDDTVTIVSLLRQEVIQFKDIVFVELSPLSNDKANNCGGGLIQVQKSNNRKVSLLGLRLCDCQSLCKDLLAKNVKCKYE